MSNVFENIIFPTQQISQHQLKAFKKLNDSLLYISIHIYMHTHMFLCVHMGVHVCVEIRRQPVDACSPATQVWGLKLR